MTRTLARTLRRVGLGSLSGIGLYLLALLVGSIAWAISSGYTSHFTIGETWSQFTVGNGSWAWLTLDNSEIWTSATSATYNLIAIVLPIIVGLAVAIWEILYFTKSEEVDFGTALKVAIMGILIIIIIRLICGAM